MIPVADALRLVLEATPVLGAERVGLDAVAGRVTAEEVHSGRTVPAADNSAMDGYAVRAADVASLPATLPIVGMQPAGPVRDVRVDAGTAVKIFTGSVVPPGADTVVRVEYTQEADGRVTFEKAEPLGANIRRAGEDIAHGAVVVGARAVIGPADVGVLASIGKATVVVHRRPRVAILSTGSELVEVDEEPGPGQVVNSNAYVLAAAVREAGGDPTVLPIVRDSPEAIRDRFAEAAESDVVLSTGGVSVGDFDFVKDVLDALGVVRHFSKVAQKPGKPLVFGTRGETLFFGLPGNPVSALVCFGVYVRPALRRLGGHRRVHLPVVEATLTTATKKASGLTEFVRVVLEPDGVAWRATPVRSQSSGVLSGMAAGAGLLIGPAEVAVLDAGGVYPVIVPEVSALERVVAPLVG